MKKSIRWIVAVLAAMLCLTGFVYAESANTRVKFFSQEFPDLDMTRYMPEGILASDGEENDPFADIKEQIRDGLIDYYQNGLTEIEVINTSDVALTADDAWTLYCNTLYDYPEETYFAKTHTSFAWASLPIQPGASFYYYPEVCADLDDDAYAMAVESAAADCFTAGMTDLEMVVAAHDWIVTHTFYDPYVVFGDYTTPGGQVFGEEEKSYTSYGVFVDGKAVCQGYSLAFKTLMDRAGIPCCYVSSEAMGHAWNMVQLDGAWYHIDCTWGDPVYQIGDQAGRVKREYLLHSDEEFLNGLSSSHHDWTTEFGYTCTESYELPAALQNSSVPVFLYKGDLLTVTSAQKVNTYTPGTEFSTPARSYSGKAATSAALWYDTLYLRSNNSTSIFSIDLSETSPKVKTAFTASSASYGLGIEEDESTGGGLLCTYLNYDVVDSFPLTPAEPWTVSGSVAGPSGNSVNVTFRVNVTTWLGENELETYSTDELTLSGAPCAYSIEIPARDKGTQYSVWYSSGDGGLIAPEGYVTEEGCVYNEHDGQRFPVDKANKHHDFSLLKPLPAVYGKLYLPEECIQTPRIRLTLEADGENYCWESSSAQLESDADGSYFPYSIDCIREGGDYSFKLHYFVLEDPDDVLVSGTEIYVSSVGGFTKNADLAAEFPHMPGDSIQQDLHLEKAIWLRGQFANEEGEPLSFDPATYQPMTYQEFETDTGSFYVRLEQDGSFAAPLLREELGTFAYLRTFVGSSFVEEPVLRTDFYYYCADGGTTDQTEATPVTVTEDGVDILFRVNTGWWAKGRVVLPAGGQITGETVDYNTVVYVYRDGTFVCTGPVHFNDPTGPWEYTLVLPKEAGEYTIRMNLPEDAFESNLLYDMEVSVTADVQGNNTVFPDLVLPMVRAAVTGTVTLPESCTDFGVVTVFVTTDAGEYTGAAQPYPGYPGSYSISIPSTDESETYTVRYAFDSPFSAVTEIMEPAGWLTQTGVTANPAEAYAFSFADPAVHDFVPMERIPYAAGKIRIPEGMTSPFTVWLASGISEETYQVDPAACQSDENGKYFPYALRADIAGFSYGEPMPGTLRYQILEDESNTLVHEWDNPWVRVSGKQTGSPFFLNAEGIPQIYSETEDLGFICGQTLTLDFMPLTWDFGLEAGLLESPHGFRGTSGTEENRFTCSYTYPGECESLTLRFAFADGAWLEVNGETVTLSEDRILVVPGKTVEITTYGGSESYFYYGFSIESITANGVTEEGTGAASVFTENGTDDPTMLEDVRAGGTLTAIFVEAPSSDGTPVVRHAIAVIYDGEGRILDILLTQAEFGRDGTAKTTFRFDNADDASTVKIFLLEDETYRPLMEDIVID